MTDETNSNWFAWDEQAKRFSYEKTEDHIFAPYVNGGKRIGDMTREELIRVIAIGYTEREDLAKALWHVVSNDGQSTLDISTEVRHAKTIVERLTSKP